MANNKITEAMIFKIAPRANKRIVREMVPVANRLFPKYKIDNPKRIALFLANIATETGGFRSLSENLNYSANRLRQVWPSRFKTLAKAKGYAHQPKKLANYVYNRYGNVGHKNWGWLYRGRGFMQTTFVDNYRTVAKVTGIDVVKHPEKLADVSMGLEAACIYWYKKGCNALADKGHIKTCRKRINGGYHGLKQVGQYYRKALHLTKNLDLSGVGSKIGGVASSTGGATGAVVATKVATETAPFYTSPVFWFCIGVVAGSGIVAYVMWKRKQNKHYKEGLTHAEEAIAEGQGVQDLYGEHYDGRRVLLDMGTPTPP